jgi:hypothetical protein
MLHFPWRAGHLNQRHHLSCIGFELTGDDTAQLVKMSLIMAGVCRVHGHVDTIRDFRSFRPRVRRSLQTVELPMRAAATYQIVFDILSIIITPVVEEVVVVVVVVVVKKD